MRRIEAAAALIAVVYNDSAAVGAELRRIAATLEAGGLNLAGWVQHDLVRPGRSRCDMELENLATGERLAISDDRGPGMRGCSLDTDCLMRALVVARDALVDEPDLLILNKFGKSEAEGGGFRALIAEAVERGIPVLLGVPRRNIEGWREFAGDLAVEVRVEDFAGAGLEAALECLGLALSPNAGDGRAAGGMTAVA